MSGRCECCNAKLSPYDMTKRHAITKEFLGLCSSCTSSVQADAYLPIDDRKDLMMSLDIPDETFDTDSYREIF